MIDINVLIELFRIITVWYLFILLISAVIPNRINIVGLLMCLDDSICFKILYYSTIIVFFPIYVHTYIINSLGLEQKSDVILGLSVVSLLYYIAII